MALMDAYGLSLVSVQAWGLLWGALSAAIIVGGLAIARFGLGANPVRTLLLVNVVLWLGTALFPLRSSIVLLAIGMSVFMFLVPFAEASEQTILQKVVPYERQGRVFGFAQSVEQAASPLTAFLISPIAQFVFIPFMTDGAGARAIGGWFGTGPDRGIALVFVVTALVGLVRHRARPAQRPVPAAVGRLPALRRVARRRAGGRGDRRRSARQFADAVEVEVEQGAQRTSRPRRRGDTASSPRAIRSCRPFLQDGEVSTSCAS